MTESGGLYAYYKSFNRLISELGAGALSNEVQVNYFIAGLNANALQNTKLTLHLHTFFHNKPTSTVTDLYAEADKVISLSKTNNGFNGNGKRAGSERGAPRSQQRDNSFKQKRPFNGNTVSPAYTQRDTSFKQRPQPSTYMKDVVCNKCQHTGHYAKNCTSTYTKSGKFLGTGIPPPNHHWTKKHAEEAKAKKAAMAKTPPQQQRQQHQQQQQQQQQQKRKKTIGAITLAELSFPPGFAPVLDAMEGSVSEFSNCDDYLDALNEDLYERTVSHKADKTNISEPVATSSKPGPWEIGSDNLDLDKW
jgi:hypothetical protein